MNNNNHQLKQTLGLVSVITIVIANVLGSGVYKKIAPMTSELNSSLWVLLAWIVAGLITLFGALSNAEIAGLLSDTGGEFSYYKKIYNKFYSFIYGWTAFTVVQTAAISSLAYVFAQSLNSLLPLPEILTEYSDINLFGIFYPFQNFSVKLTAISAIILLSWINSLGIEFGTKISKFILLFVIVGIGSIIIFGLSSEKALISRAFESNIPHNTVNISTFFSAMLAAFWAYQGWASIGFVGGEIKNPSRNIPKGITIGVISVILIYVLINTVYLSLLPINEIAAITTQTNKIAAIEATKVFWGNGGITFISGLIILTTLGCTHMTILASCRTYYAMARENLFFKPVATLNSKKVPANSLLYQGIWASILVLSGSFDQLTDMVIFAIFIFYASTTYGVIVLRRKMPDVTRPYKVFGYPYIPILFIIFSLGLFINTIITKPREAILGLFLILLGIPMYYWFQKNK
ncbi:MAG: amino acid permease [Limnohabitans sp.]|nr:amino acid permease [Limnohabitans sp.]